MKYTEEAFNKINKYFINNINKVFRLFEEIMLGNFSWDLFINYQDILMDTLYKIKEEEFKLKHILKSIRKNNNKKNNEKKIMIYIDRIENGENQIKMFGDFLAWIFYYNTEDLIDNHMKQDKVGINSVGSGIYAEIFLVKQLNKSESEQFYLYNNITSFLRLGDVSVFDKRVCRIIGFGEIKSSIPDSNSKMDVSIDIISNYKNLNIGKEAKNDEFFGYDFLSDNMNKHLQKQIDTMKSNLAIQKPDAQAGLEIDKYHYDKLEKLINKCHKNGYAFIKVSDNVAYLSIKNNMKEIDFDSIIDKDILNSLFCKNPSNGQNRLVMSNLNILSYGKSVPFLLNPLTITCKRKMLKQSIVILYNYNYIIEELKKDGFEYKMLKKRPTLVKIENGSKIKIDLNSICETIPRMFVDEHTVVKFIKKTLVEIKNNKVPLNSNIYVNLVNRINKPEKNYKFDIGNKEEKI